MSIYLDHAATTPLEPAVLEAMLPYFGGRFGNPGGLYSLAREARRTLDDARDSVAADLGAAPGEIAFTSGGTESDHVALKGVAHAGREWGDHVVTTAIEHHAVLAACADLEREGFRVTRLPVDREGVVDLDALAAAVDERTILVSVMHANNEVGTIEPLADVVEVARRRNPRIRVHTDAVQSVGALAVRVGQLDVDLLSLSAHKLAGPKGSGALYLRRGTPFRPLQAGSQERGRRGGTENVPGIVGLAAALRLAVTNRAAREQRLLVLRDRLIAGILANVRGAVLTGHPTNRLPGHASFAFPGVDSESILLALDRHDIAASAGAACASGSLEPSHVLRALDLPSDLARGALRLTLGHENTTEEVDRAVSVVRRIAAEFGEGG